MLTEPCNDQVSSQSFQWLAQQYGWSIDDSPWICNLERGHEGLHSYQTWHQDEDADVLPFKSPHNGTVKP